MQKSLIILISELTAETTHWRIRIRTLHISEYDLHDPSYAVCYSVFVH